MVRHLSKQRPRGLPWHWGAAPPRGDDLEAITRTVVTRAGAAELMLWVAQLQRAPYSYDWIDNLGRRSPRLPDRTLHNYVGASVMYIFTISEHGEHHVQAHMTSRLPRTIFGRVSIRYDVQDYGKVRALRYTMWIPVRTILGRLRRYVLAWADLIMARKQLLTLAALAAATTGSTIEPSR